MDGPFGFASMDSLEIPQRLPVGVSYRRSTLPRPDLITLPPRVTALPPPPLHRSRLTRIFPGLQSLLDPSEAIVVALSHPSLPTDDAADALSIKLIASHDAESGHANEMEADLAQTQKWPLSWWGNPTPLTGPLRGKSVSLMVRLDRSDGRPVTARYG